MPAGNRNRNTAIFDAVGDFLQHPFKSLAHTIGEVIGEIGGGIGQAVGSVVKPVGQEVTGVLVEGVTPAVRQSIETVSTGASGIVSSLAAPLQSLSLPLMIGGIVLAILLFRKIA